MENHFKIFQLKEDCPVMMLLLLLKTKGESFGLVPETMPTFIMEKHLPFSKIKTVKPSTTFGH